MASVTTIIVGIFLHVWMIFELDFILPLESKITLIGFFPFTYLTVNEGSSIIIVRFPISIASTFDLSLCTLIRSFFEDNLESPVFVAIFPSKLTAALSNTYGLDFTMYYFTTNHYRFDYRFRCSMHN